ncbi:MAG TPA: hypothetical protein VJZ00_06790 [Thermoanaerobaculia bacterium]|nr:hypothetical protein [Thermoanaerobaculia bacterium]
MTSDAMTAAPAVSSLASWIARVWREAKRLYLFLMPLRFSFLALIVIAFAFLVSAQGYDIIANLAEDDPTGATPPHTGQRIGYIFGVIFMAVQIWYWSRQLLHVKAPEGTPHSDEYPWLTTWLPRILGALTFILSIGSLYRVARNYGVPEPVLQLRLMSIYLIVALLLFLGFTIVRRKLLHESTSEEKTFKERGRWSRLVIIGTLVVSALFFLWTTFYVQSTVALGSAAIVLLAFGLLVPVGSTLVWLGIRGGVPVLTFMIVWAVIISPLADNHVVQTIPANVMKRPSVATGFDSWFERLQKQYPPGPDGKYSVFLVATEGGGIRAAYWTAAVLTSLTDTVPTFSDHLFAISSVSGGSLGATVYDALLVRRGDYKVNLDEVEYTPQAGEQFSMRLAARQILSEDSLAPVLAAMTQPDFAQRFIPYPFLPDRARALEGGWERAWHTAIQRRDNAPDNLFAGGFLQMMGGRESRMPSLFLNGTVTETGQRIIASNLQIVDGDNTNHELAQAIDLFGAIGGDIRVSTAAHNSARFSYVSPAGTLKRAKNSTGGSSMSCAPGESCEHVVDGGYFENSGSATASDILDTIAASKYASRVQPHIIFIQFDMAQPKPIKGEKMANEVMSPVRALAAVRGAHADLATEELQRRMTKVHHTTFQLIQTKAVFPLGWLLADRTRNLMDAQMGPDSKENGANVKQIAAVLGNPKLRADIVQQLAVKGEAQPRFQ